MQFTEEQMVEVLRESEVGAKTVIWPRKHVVSKASLYNLTARYGGLEMSEAKLLRALEDEWKGGAVDHAAPAAPLLSDPTGGASGAGYFEELQFSPSSA